MVNARTKICASTTRRGECDSKDFFIYQINIDIIVPYLSLTENSKLNKPFFKLIPSFKNIKNNKNNAYFGVEMLFLEFHQSKDAQIKF